MNIKWIRFGVCKWTYVLLVCCGNVLIASGQVSNSIVIPNEYSDKPGENLGTTIEGFYQFTYLNSQFQAIGDDDIAITSVGLRPTLNAVGSSLDVIVPTITISMGTFTKPLSQVSAIAANNRGADFTQVYSHENVPLHFVPNGDPNNFSIVFNLDAPFHFNPRNGQFIFEWRASDFPNRPNARIDYGGHFPPGETVYAAGELADALGYSGFVTRLGYTIVPEPSPFYFIIVFYGLICFFKYEFTRRVRIKM